MCSCIFEKRRTLMATTECESIYTLDCVHGTRPPCSCACPMNPDLREFMAKAQRRNPDSAYRLLANELIFPEIVTRLCGGSCAGSCAENIDIPALERAVIKYASQKAPMRFSVAQKDKRVAVIGAGISGMMCAQRFAVRGFRVTVFDKRPEIGGGLSEIMPREVYMEEFALQLKYAQYEFRGNTEIKSLDELSDFDAIYIATGRGGNDFGLLTQWNARSMATSRRACCLGGELTGADRIHAAAQGRIAGYTLEKYLLMSESMSGVESSFIQEKCLFDVKNSGAVSAPHEGGFDKVSLREEAARCRRCDCTACFDQCAFLKSMNMFPPDVEAITRTLPVRDVALGQREGSRMTFSCAVCGHCGSVCPKGISIEQMMLGAKRTLFELNAFPPQIHSYYISDMLEANGRDALMKLPEGGAEYLFFPGCQAAQSGAEHVKKAYGFLSHCGRTGIWLGCCGIPAKWAGDEELFRSRLAMLKEKWQDAGRPVVVMMCPTCMKTFAEYLPEVRCVSVYELMAEKGMSAASPIKEAAVFDACAAKSFPAMRRAVRELSRSAGVALTELDPGGDKALCCGNSGHIYTANKKVYSGMNGSAAALSDKPYITYCENCRNSFLMNGKDCRHVLDLVFGLESAKAPPHIDELKENRRKLKAFFENADVKEDPHGMKISVSDELFKTLDRRLISLKDVEAVISEGEITRRRIRLEGEGHYIGHKTIGYFTLWAEYKKLGEGEFELINAYSHKMSIAEGR